MFGLILCLGIMMVVVSFLHKFNNGQWLDYSGGAILGYKLNKSIGMFVEGKYNKYWNREWYDFKFGVNYVIF